MRRTQWLVAAIVIAAGVVNSVIAATFTSLGNLGGGVIPNSFAFGVSGDGSVIVGNSTSPLGGGAYRWDAVNGMVRIDGETEVGDYSRARAANFDGSIVVGTSYSLPGSFRWDAVNGMVALGGGEALGISDDGEVIVGQASGEAFRWDAINGMVGLGHIAG